MVRYEGKNIAITSNENSTKVAISRMEEGLTLKELRRLVAALSHALADRVALEKAKPKSGPCARCSKKVKSLTTGDYRYCTPCYVDEFGEKQMDVCMHGNDPNHAPCHACFVV